jgi:hypothetical protein
MFSSYLPFQIEYTDWKVLKDTTEVDDDWYAIDYNDNSWSTLKAADIGTSSSVTTYIRKTFALTTASDYQVLNVRVKYEGGVVAYFNGRTVARFNLAEGYGSETESTAVHDSSSFSNFHIILPTVGVTSGNNVIAFEIHRPKGYSSSDPVVFDATGVFGVNDCSVVVDTYNVDMDSSTAPTYSSVSGSWSPAFDLSSATYCYLSNTVGSHIDWSVENLEGSKFNSFGLETPYLRTSIGISLYGKFTDDEDETSMLAVTGQSTTALSRTLWSVDVGIAGFNSFKYELDTTASSYVYISSFIFAYCKTSGEGVCEGDGDYPAVGDGQKSPSSCAYGYRGYSYRLCSNGVLGSVNNEFCTYKLPGGLNYRGSPRRTLVKDVVTNIPAPSYNNLITKFYLDDNVFLPDGLELDETTGAITGTPTKVSSLQTYTIYGSNPAGVTYTTLSLQVRVGQCLGEGNFETTEVGVVAEYNCALQGSYIGTQKRACILGATDGEWQKIQGVCVPTMMIVLLVLVVIVIIFAVFFFIGRTKKAKAVGGVKSGKKSGKGAAKKTSSKAVKV